MSPAADRQVAFIDRLGFGFANVVVAVPQAWIDVRNMADLDDVATAFRLKHERKMRLATKYANLTRAFFTDQGVVDYRIVESSGATEAAPAAGTAELIVDITTTGTTLAANGLKVIEDGVILRSQANLVAARSASWDAAQRETARLLLDRIAAQKRGHAYREVRTRFPGLNETLLNTAREQFGVAAPFGGPTSSGMLTLHCRPSMCMRSQASCASRAPRRCQSPRSNTSMRATIRCLPGSPPSSMRVRRAAAETGCPETTSCQASRTARNGPELAHLDIRLDAAYVSLPTCEIALAEGGAFRQSDAKPSARRERNDPCSSPNEADNGHGRRSK